MVRFQRCLFLGLGLLALAGSVLHAQLDLPKGKAKGPRGEKKSLEVPIRPRGDLGPKPERKTGSPGDLEPGARGGQLDLPPGKRATGKAVVDPASIPATYEASHAGAAKFIFDELAKARAAEGGVARDAVESLAALGEAGLAAARLRLPSEHPPTLVVSSRLLLTFGTQADHRMVADRLKLRIPTAAAAPMLGAIVELDPVLAAPGYLVSLLDHRSGAVRSAAHRVLEKQVGPEHLPLLATVLRARRSDTRLRSVDLAARVDDPAAVNLLVNRLGDDSPKVGLRCAELLAVREGPGVVDTTLERAFGTPSLDRGAAYALLSLILREEQAGVALLGPDHVPALLNGLHSSEAIVVGTSAAALAGIGFRSPRSEETKWLDLDVPHQLVRLSSGVEFHPDFSSLRSIAPRRLALISGKSFGSDGAAWQRWWAESAHDFRARRAVIEVGEGMEATLEITYRTGPWAEGAIHLCGADVPADRIAASPVLGTRLFLTARECADLVALLQREGVFGAERVSGRIPSGSSASRVLEITVQDQGKRFMLPGDETEPWFDRIAAAVEATAERNRWQLFPDLARYPDARAMWAAESAWWELDHGPEECDRRFVDQLFVALKASAPADRDAGVNELVRLYARPGVPSSIDLPAVLGLLAQEQFLGRRASDLVDLALTAAGNAGGDAGAPAADRIDASLGRGIIDVLVRAMDDRAAPAVARVLRASAPELVGQMASDPAPFLRAMSASVLAADPAPEARAQAMALLEDPDPLVESAAVLALGRHGVEEARSKILVRARLAATDVRIAALLAAGELGGEGALEVLRLALYETDGRVQVAGAEGLGALADPESVDLLVRLFARGTDSPFFEPAQRGLRALGAVAWEELLRLCFSGADATRRDASLLLAEQGVAEVTTNLITLLTKNPRDARVAHELAVLTCIDLREEKDPAQAWWNWWDTVVHDDSLAWLRGAAEREGVAAPPTGALGPEGTRDGALFLVRLLSSEVACVAERARRELARMLDGEPGDPPPRGPLRDEWIDGLRALVEMRFAGR